MYCCKKTSKKLYSEDRIVITIDTLANGLPKSVVKRANKKDKIQYHFNYLQDTQFILCTDSMNGWIAEYKIIKKHKKFWVMASKSCREIADQALPMTINYFYNSDSFCENGGIISFEIININKLTNTMLFESWNYNPEYRINCEKGRYISFNYTMGQFSKSILFKNTNIWMPQGWNIIFNEDFSFHAPNFPESIINTSTYYGNVDKLQKKFTFVFYKVNIPKMMRIEYYDEDYLYRIEKIEFVYIWKTIW